MLFLDHQAGVIKDSKFTKNLSPSYFSTACGMTSSANTSDHEGDPNWATVNYGDLEALGNLHPSTSATQNVLGSSGIPRLAPTDSAWLHSDLRSSFDDQRHREFYGGMQQYPYMVKREDIVVGRPGKRHHAGSPGSQAPRCQVEGCKADLSTAKDYHRRHKVCSFHSKASDVVVASRVQRFCLQCSRYFLSSQLFVTS